MSASPPPGGAVHYLEEALPISQQRYWCGPAALASVFQRWGRTADADEIGRALVGRGERGVMNFDLARYARTEGFWTQTHHDGDLLQLKKWLRKGIPPIVMLKVGPLGLPFYHFIVARGFNDREGVVYANTGQPKTRAIPYSSFQKRWSGAGGWLLVVCPPEKVDWELTPVQTADLAFLLERNRRWAPAQRRYEEALRGDPANRSLRFNLANVSLRLGQREKAQSLYQALLKEMPSHPVYANNLAWTYLEEGDYRRAVQIGEETLRRLNRRPADLLDTVGLAYCRLKNTEKGRSYLMEALEQLPPESEASQAVQNHLRECF